MSTMRIWNLGSPRDKLDVVHKYYVNSRLIELVKLDGSRSMTGNLNLNNHSIIDLKDPKDSDTYFAANGNYVNKK